jgi:hypothetical protein
MALFVAAGCLGQRPRTLAQQYVGALKQHNYAECYVMMTAADRQARAPNRFVSAIPLAPDVASAWFKLVLDATNYEVGESRREGPRAVVPVMVATPDLARFERSVEAYVGSDGEPVPLARDSLKGGDYPRITYEDEIVMVKEHHRWRILVDFPARDAAAADRRKALEAYYRFDLNQAIRSYNDALEVLRKSDATGSRGLEFLYGRELAEIMAVQSEAQAEKAYLPKLRVEGVGMKMSAAHRPAIFGRITNTGKRTIDGIQMAVTFFRGSGASRRSIFVERHIPISTPLEFTNFTIRTTPIAPGETRQFGFELAAPLSVQEAGDPFVEISQVIFTPSTLMPVSIAPSDSTGHDQQE